MLSCSLVQEILLLHEGAKIPAVPEFLPHDYLPSITVLIQDNISWAREIGQQLRVHAGQAKDPSSVPSSHIKQLNNYL